MNISCVLPRPELQPYIRSLWVFESALGMPETAQSMAAPNGCPKMIIPCQNSLKSVADGRSQVSRERGLYLVGNRETPTLIHSSQQQTRFIAIEFEPHGAFPVFGIPMHETRNGLFDSEAVFGAWGRHVRESLGNLDDIDEKVHRIQEELTKLLSKNTRENGLITYCVRSLDVSNGRIPIKELEQRTGFTLRYLDQLFRQHVGLSPKTLAGIFRFRHFYSKWAQGLSYEFMKDDLHDYYFDQAHFTREFKRMTGHSPRRFTRQVSNEFGRRLAAQRQF